MALAPIDRQQAQTATSSMAAINRSASQFDRAALRAKAGKDSTSSAREDGQTTSLKPNLSKVQSRDQRDQGGQQHHGKRVVIVDGVKITTEDGHVTRVRLGSVEPLIKTNNAVNIIATSPETDLMRKALLTTSTVAPTMPRPLDVRSGRLNDAATKVSNDGSTGSAAVLNSEAAIHNQQNSGGSSGGGKQQGQGGQNGDKPGDKQGGGDNLGNSSGSGGLPPRGGIFAAGAAPDPDDFNAPPLSEAQNAYFQALTDRGIPDSVAMWIARSSLNGQDSDYSVVNMAEQFEIMKIFIDDPSEIVAMAAHSLRGKSSSALIDYLGEIFHFTDNSLFSSYSHQETVEAATSIIQSTFNMWPSPPGDNENIATAFIIARFLVGYGVSPADAAACFVDEKMSSSTAGMILDTIMQAEAELGWINLDPHEIVSKINDAAEYLDSYDIEGMRDEGVPLRDIIVDIMSGQLLNIGENVSLTRREDLFEIWQNLPLIFTVTAEQEHEINRLLVDIELSQDSYDYNVSGMELRYSLKNLASYLILDHGKGGALSYDDALDLIDELLTSKRDQSERQNIVCYSARFIRNFPYNVRAKPEEVKADYRAALDLSKDHNLTHEMSTIFWDIREDSDYAALDIDFLRSPDRDAIMEYLISSSDRTTRKTAMATVMLSTGLPADEAALHVDLQLGERAEQIRKWARVTPSSTELPSFQQAIQLEYALSFLARQNISLTSVLGAPLDAFIRQGLDVDRSFKGLERVLLSWNWEPLDQFMGAEFRSWEAPPVSQPIKDTLAQFPSDFIIRLANDGLDPEIVADLLVGSSSASSAVPVAEKHAVAIMQATNGSFTLRKLQELVPYLNESKIPSMALTAIANSFLESETQLAELEMLWTTEGSQLASELNPQMRNSMAIENALNTLYAIDDFPEVYLDFETADITLKTKNGGAVEQQAIDDWCATHQHTARLVLDRDTNNYVELSSETRFHVQFPGQVSVQPAHMPEGGFYSRRMIPPGTAIVISYVDSNRDVKSAIFRLPPIRSRAGQG